MPKPPPSGATPNIVLIGFMGSGKTTVGRILAAKTGLRFVDTDEEIEKAAGKPIPQIFREIGEDGFRELESSALAGLAGRHGLVVSTGGGIVIRPANRELLRRIGFVVWLAADEKTIYRRVSKSRDRPLLRNPNPRETIRNLLAARSALYAQSCDLRIDTAQLTSEEIAYGIKESLAHAVRGTPPAPPAPKAD